MEKPGDGLEITRIDKTWIVCGADVTGRHDICQNIFTRRLWTNYVLPEKHNSQHITFRDKTVLNLEDFGWIVEHVNCCKCVTSVLVTINCANKIGITNVRLL